MPTNQQRREAAKRKLERQLVRREQHQRQRRQRLMIIGVVAAVLVVAGTVVLITTRKNTNASDGTGATGASGASGSPSSAAPKTPCTYPTADAAKAVKPVKAPENVSPDNKGSLDATITLNGAPVVVSLNRALAPCAVNSFVSLASQGFYNGTDCWRLTASPDLNVLQCGDPTGKGNGGPGYTFADEVKAGTKYPVGTVAMANGGPDTNGSQFFLVYGTTTLPASYTVFGTISGDGLKAVQAIAAKGVAKNAQDGPPAEKATISAVTVPDGAVSATGSYPSSPAATSGGSGAPSGGSGAPSAPTTATSPTG